MRDTTIDVEALLREVEADAPCGPNLEYDPAFLELEQEAQGKPEVQYGATVMARVPPDWKVVRRLAAGLLERSRDLRVIAPMLRAATALEGVAGLASCMQLLARLLEERWDSVHPQLDPDDGMDPLLRINSLAALVDAGTVLREVKEAPLLMLPGLGPFSLRELEIANGEVEPPEGQQKLSMASVEAAIRDVEPERLAAAGKAMRIALDSAIEIEALLVRRVGSSQALNLEPLTRMLRRGRDFLDAANPAAAPAADAQDGAAPAAASAPGAPARAAAISGDIGSRDDVLRMLDKICNYYQQHEPSSPVPLLLARAKRLVPKNFFEILEDLAPDGMAQLTAVSGQRE
ncbi:type VI secretion system protein TssA [Massilia sp. R2A-15]|uniref:type VI secretion system protein TssA n=1 Tax=Massilia sp. R2A-15 TaxID=3064278 RepID=UPI002732CA41|nr:type VI secretion system protein TssA [Massilia sp. R2A-15]WLI89450.1 type VI secretion system protein TssA [Massilia sp. R2A-15]